MSAVREKDRLEERERGRESEREREEVISRVCVGRVRVNESWRLEKRQ